MPGTKTGILYKISNFIFMTKLQYWGYHNQFYQLKKAIGYHLAKVKKKLVFIHGTNFLM